MFIVVPSLNILELKTHTDDADMQAEVLKDIREKWASLEVIAKALSNLWLYRVNENKKTLLNHAEEGAKMLKGYETITQQMNELKITHQWVAKVNLLHVTEWWCPCHRETVQILENEINDFQVKLKESARTKEVVISTYDELTKTVEERAEDHKATMAELYTTISDNKKKSAAMAEQVILCKMVRVLKKMKYFFIVDKSVRRSEC